MYMIKTMHGCVRTTIASALWQILHSIKANSAPNAMGEYQNVTELSFTDTQIFGKNDPLSVITSCQTSPTTTRFEP